MAKVKSGLGGLSIAQTIVATGTPLTKMGGNPNFPNPPIPIPELEAERQTLASLEEEFQSGNKTVKTMRNSTFKSFKKNITITVGYVNGVAKGDPTLLQSSGFEMAKDNSPIQVPGKVKRINCKNEPESGACHINWAGVKERSFYIVQQTYTPEDSNSWMEVDHVTGINCKAYGLTTGSWAYFRVCAVNRAGRGEWSAEMKLMVS